jgi:Glycosyl transferase family 2
MAPLVSVVMIDGSFRRRFHAVERFARQELPAGGHEVIWVEHYDRPGPALLGVVSGLPNVEVVALGRTGTYHSSHCFNAGITAARGELVVVPDGDVIVEPDFLARLWELHRDAERLVTYCYRYNEPEEQRSLEVSLPHLREVGVLTHPFNWGGCLAVRRRWLLEVNGYEQHPLFASGDHGNDYDMYVRLKNLGLPISWPRRPVLYHPWHPGTLHYALSHRLQAQCTEHRARTLAYLPFNGIDPSLDSPMPEALAAELRAAAAELAATTPDAESPPVLRQQR